MKAGPAALAGNHVVIELSPTGPYVLLAHLRRGSTRVSVGELVAAGQQLAGCGNSGNSTEPHLHLQVSDSIDWKRAHGLPLAFRQLTGRAWVPRNAEIVAA